MHNREPTALLISRLLGGGGARRFDLAQALLSAAGTLGRLRRLSLVDLADLGLSRAEALRVKGALELGRRALTERSRPHPVEGPRQAYRCVAGHLLGSERERFVVVALDVRNRPLSVAVVSEGAVDSCPVDAREVYVQAIRERASGIVVAHSHPSGDPTPSTEDLALTERLRRAGELLGVPLLDHLIVGVTGRWVSLVASGVMPPSRPGTAEATRRG